MVMKKINIKATKIATCLSASMSLWMGVLCNAATAQTGPSQGRWATEHEEMLIEEGYIFFPPLRTRRNSPPDAPQNAPSVTPVQSQAPVQTATLPAPAPRSTPQPTPQPTALATPQRPTVAAPLATPLLVTQQDTPQPHVASAYKADAPSPQSETSPAVTAGPKPNRPPLKEKSLLFLTLK